MKKGEAKEKTTIAYLAWASIAIFYFYVYIMRVAPGVMIHEIRQEFGLTADAFATLGSFYLYAYSLLQIPLGILVDRIGVRKVILSSIFLCIGGTALFALTRTFVLVQISRVMIGAGSGAAFMCALKVIADRLPAGKRGFLMGLTLTLGTIGALAAGKPLAFLVDTVGWRTTVLFSSILGFLVFFVAFLFLPKRAPGRSTLEQETMQSIGSNILSVVKNGRVMLYAFLAIGLYTPLSALAELWGTAFLMQKFELPRGDAAHTTMMMFIGLAAGSIFMPWLCEKYHLLDRAIQVCCVGALCLFAFLLFGPVVNSNQLTLLMLLIGFFGGGEMMCFTGALSHTNPDNSGITIGVVNTANMLGGAFLQQFIGYSLDLEWKGLLDEHGIRIYNTQDFISALSIIVIIVFVCSIASLWLFKNKKKKQVRAYERTDSI